MKGQKLKFLTVIPAVLCYLALMLALIGAAFASALESAKHVSRLPDIERVCPSENSPCYDTVSR